MPAIVSMLCDLVGGLAVGAPLCRLGKGFRINAVAMLVAAMSIVAAGCTTPTELGKKQLSEGNFSDAASKFRDGCNKKRDLEACKKGSDAVPFNPNGNDMDQYNALGALTIARNMTMQTIGGKAGDLEAGGFLMMNLNESGTVTVSGKGCSFIAILSD